MSWWLLAPRSRSASRSGSRPAPPPAPPPAAPDRRRAAVPDDRDQPRRGPRPRHPRRARRRSATATSTAPTSRSRRRSGPTGGSSARTTRCCPRSSRCRCSSAVGSAPSSRSPRSPACSPPRWCGSRSCASACRLAAAVVTVLAFAAGAPLAVYGTQVYPELPAALAVTLAIAALDRPARAGARSLGAGVCIVALPWLSVKYAPVAAALAAACARGCTGARGDRRLVCVVRRRPRASPASCTSSRTRPGTAAGPSYASGDHFVGGEMTVVGIEPDYPGRAVRLVGLLIDRDFGLVAWNPRLPARRPGARVPRRRRPRRWPVLVAAARVGWLNATFVALTMHGWWWPGRQVVVVLPCVVLAVAWWAASSRTCCARVAVLGIARRVHLHVVGRRSERRATSGSISTFEHDVEPARARRGGCCCPTTATARPRDWVLHGAWLVALVATRARRRAAAALGAPYSIRPRPTRRRRRWQ